MLASFSSRYMAVTHWFYGSSICEPKGRTKPLCLKWKSHVCWTAENLGTFLLVQRETDSQVPLTEDPNWLCKGPVVSVLDATEKCYYLMLGLRVMFSTRYKLSPTLGWAFSPWSSTVYARLGMWCSTPCEIKPPILFLASTKSKESSYSFSF